MNSNKYLEFKDIFKSSPSKFTSNSSFILAISFKAEIDILLLFSSPCLNS